MSYLYEFDNTYTREDMIDELHAYILNERESFDFGEGEMKMESFEVASYGFQLSVLEASYFASQYPKEFRIANQCKNDTSVQVKFNRYYVNHVRQKQRERKLHESDSLRYLSGYWEKDGMNGKTYLKRCYRGKRSKHLKRQSHKIMRRNTEYFPKGNKINRLYDFWWELY